MTGISWTDETWNPVRGCSRVSEGCRHCYAEQQAARIVRMGKGQPTPYDGLVSVRSKVSGLRYKDINAAGSWDEPRWTGVVRLAPERLADPLRWRRPRRVFVNSMSDLFHESLTNEQIAAVFGIMAACPQHTFQILTKRARRMREWFEWLRNQSDPYPAGALDYLDDTATDALAGHYNCCHLNLMASCRWPLRNVWLGVSVENQDAADERGDDLRETPAAVHFWSVEPQLGDVNARRWLGRGRGCEWLINGCESGPGARPCATSWLRSLRDQCKEAGVPFFLKQAHPWVWVEGERAPGHANDDGSGVITAGPGSRRKPGGVIELPYLDGEQHAAFPESP